MSEQGAALQTYNQELVKYIEEMKSRRATLQKAIELEEAEKNSLEAKLNQLNDSLAAKKSTKVKLDHVIRETDVMYNKIIESSQALLNMAKQEAANLNILKYNLEESSD